MPVTTPAEDLPAEDLPDSPLTSFLKTVKTDSSLQQALSAASDANVVTDIAKTAGVVISRLDAKLLMNAMLLKQKPWEALASKNASESDAQQPDAGRIDAWIAKYSHSLRILLQCRGSCFCPHELLLASKAWCMPRLLTCKP
jgi:hypothetical protein